MIQGDTKKNRSHKKSNNFKTFYSNLKYFLRPYVEAWDDLCAKFQVSIFKTLYLATIYKTCSKWAVRRWKHTCTLRAKFSIPLSHSSLEIPLATAVIAAPSSGMGHLTFVTKDHCIL